MYIIAIAWLYVTVLMALTESNLIAGTATFLFYGLLPLSLLMWLGGTRARRQRQAAMEASSQQTHDDAPNSPPGA